MWPGSNSRRETARTPAASGLGHRVDVPRAPAGVRGLGDPNARNGRQVTAKVVLVGDAGVGKTSLVRRYVSDAFDEDYLMTLGVIVTKRSVGLALEGVPARVTMLLWDTMGEHALASTLREPYLREARGVLLVCDGSDARTALALRAWIEASRRIAGDPEIAVLANKSDLGIRPETVDIVLRGAFEGPAPCYATSAKTGRNVEAVFREVALRIAIRALEPEGGPLDPVSLGIVIDASVRPRTLGELSRSARLAAGVALARAFALVRRGYLQVTRMDLDPEGLPDPTFTATGKRFPRVGPGMETRESLGIS